MARVGRKRVGEILFDKGLITKEQLDEALAEQARTGKRIETVLIEHGLVSGDNATSCLALKEGFTYLQLSKLEDIKSETVKIIPERMARRFMAIAISQKKDTLVVAMVDPMDVVAIDSIKSTTGYEIEPVLSFKDEILEAIDKYYGEFADIDIGTSIQDLVKIEGEEVEEEEVDVTQLKLQADDAPVIKFVNLLLLQSIEERASDLHIEPTEKGISIRLRIDGVLREFPPPPRKLIKAIVSRIKIISDMNIAERRLPQDGRCKVRIGDKAVDIRVSTLPTIYGEKVVMRLLDKSKVLLSLKDLGFDPDDQAKVEEVLKKPWGTILVTGPTGSGKTTTLYAGLNYLRSPGKNIITVEDPVEYELEGINQVQVRSGIGLTFANTLRSILRQDPDIIMIGEIRDLETAEIAIQAALTGHLVLSTLHTNNAPSAITRMMDMGVPPYLIASSVDMVIAQRLGRRICQNCKEPYDVPQEILKHLNVSIPDRGFKFYRGKGCEQCGNTGYLGRVALYEVFPLSDIVKELVLGKVSEASLREQAVHEGMSDLRASGIRKVLDGLTTVEEILAVTGG